MGTFKILDQYTADIGIEIKAKDYEDLIKTIIDVFNYLVFQKRPKTDEKTIVKTFHYPIDSGFFVIDFFNDLIYIFETNGLVPIDTKNISKNNEKINFDIIFKKCTSKPIIQIKAATYHDFYFNENENIKTRMVFDL